eukprot:gene11327-biopygen181
MICAEVSVCCQGFVLKSASGQSSLSSSVNYNTQRAHKRTNQYATVPPAVSASPVPAATIAPSSSAKRNKSPELVLGVFS